MSKLTDQACIKMAEECKGKRHLVPIEEYLTGICTTDAVASKILADDKKLYMAFGKIKSVAESRKIDNCGYVPNDEAFEIVEEYYGITDEDKRPERESNVVDLADFL